MIDLFTKQEKLFIGFLLMGMLVGAAIQMYRAQRKPVRPPNQIQEMGAFEKSFYKKAILIDSLLAEATLSANSENYGASSNSAAKDDIGSGSNLAGYRVDLNHASIDELVKLPQIGRVIAARIVAYRSAHGDFKDIEDVMNVKGIGEKKFKAIRSHIYIKKN